MSGQATRQPGGRALFVFFAVVLALILLVAFAPLIAALAAGVVAHWNGCTLHGGAGARCMIDGVDRGRLLAEMLVAGRYGMVTVPAGIVVLAIWAVAAVSISITRRRRTE